MYTKNFTRVLPKSILLYKRKLFNYFLREHDIMPLNSEKAHNLYYLFLLNIVEFRTDEKNKQEMF